MLKLLTITAMLFSVTSAQAGGLMLVRNTQSGENECKAFLEEQLGVPGQLTVKEQKGVDDNGNKVLVAAIFLLNGKGVGGMYPSSENPDMAECELLQ